MDNPIVISGMSGRLPECDTVEEFMQKLLAGMDLVTDDDRRYPAGMYNLPPRTGKLNDLSRFDAPFFGVPPKQAFSMDPGIRMILEVAYEAIVDAGINPAELRGSNTGVFIGSFQNESLDFSNQDAESINGYGLLGGARAILANRISYAFDFHGPSYAMDTACSSSLMAFQQAFDAVKTGRCSYALAGGVNIITNPRHSLQFHTLGVLSPDGKCKSFDESGDGYVRSEAVGLVFIQRYSTSKRVYAKVLGTRSNTDGYKKNGMTFPSGVYQKQLVSELYSEIKLDPRKVVYIEAHGTGTKAGDPQELNGIVDIFCKEGRESTLMIGSVKSSIGHTEPASGVCSLIKVILSMEAGIIPANLHYNNPNSNIPGLHDGTLHVIDKNTKWNGGIVGINSFGFGGTNSHAILSSHTKSKTRAKTSKIPRVVTVSGRTEESVDYFLDQIQKTPYDEEFYALIDGIHEKRIVGHDFRGFCLINEGKANEVKQIDGSETPVWFVFSGMGSQRGDLSKSMMDIEPFRKSIEASAGVLKKVGVDLMKILVDEDLLKNVINSFVLISSVQIALVDTLKVLGIEADGIIGHSLGEVGCGYADGTLTAEQAVLVAYHRGKAFMESKIKNGAMAAVGLPWDECKAMFSTEIDIACNNSADNVTISGPSESVAKVIKTLSDKGIFAKLVDSSGFAFHSSYLKIDDEKLLGELNKVIPNPKLRSSKWISTSTEKSQWGIKGTFSDSYYYVNNLHSPVYFYEGTQLIPENVVAVEISPHCVLQSILKRSLPKTINNIGLLKKGSGDDVTFFLSNIGRIYNSGCDVNISALYPPVEFPVSKGTPNISSMIKWNHSVQWGVPDFVKNARSSELAFEIDLNKEEHSYLSGHVIDGKLLFPGSGYIVLVWKAFANLRNQDFEQVPVVFEDVKFLRTTIMSKEAPTRFLVNILSFSGEFEVTENEEIVAKGKIYTPNEIDGEYLNFEPKPVIDGQNTLALIKNDIYKILRLTGFEHQGMFQGLVSSDQLVTNGRVSWGGNWVTFIDCLFQYYTIHEIIQGGLKLPTGIKKAVINPKAHVKDDSNEIGVYTNGEMRAVRSGGIEIREIEGSAISKRKQPVPKIEKYDFTPFVCNEMESLDDVLAVFIQTVAENSFPATTLKIAEVVPDDSSEVKILGKIETILENEPYLYLNGIVISGNYNINTKFEFGEKLVDEMHLIIYSDVLINEKFDEIQNGLSNLKPGGFILFEESIKYFQSDLLGKELEIIYKHVASEKTYILTRKPVKSEAEPFVIEMKPDSYEWLEPLKAAMDLSESNGCRIYLVSHDEISGILGLITCIRREPGGTNIRAFFIQGDKVEKFSLKSNFYKKIIEKDLAQNVYKNNIWGNYRHSIINPKTYKEVDYAYLDAENKGDLSSLEWFEGKLNDTDKICDVYFAGLSGNDLLLANGRKSEDFCAEFSGRDSAGRKLMGLNRRSCLTSKVVYDEAYLWEVPDKWSLMEAATVPMSYAMSYYALIMKGNLQPEESLLITNGCNPISLASISIASKMGCEVFTTASDELEKDFLRKQFPRLANENIINLSNTSFEKLILTKTKGVGVDLVLNSLQGENFLPCLKNGGGLIEMGNSATGGSMVVSKNASFHNISTEVFFELNSGSRKRISSLIKAGISNGEIRPLPCKTFDKTQLEEAFKFLQTNTNKIIVLLKINEEVGRVYQKQIKIKALAQSFMDSSKVYIVVGGLGGFGLELTDWLIKRGARTIFLSSRRDVSNGYQAFRIKHWRNQGVDIQVSTVDVTTIKGAKELINKANSFGKVGGIFNLAAILKDSILRNQNEAEFKSVADSKFATTKNLDQLSRTLTPDLDYFVCFSSASCGRGNIGQGSYGYANSALERVCEKRKSSGLPALAVQWGQISDVGMVAEKMQTERTDVVTTTPQKIPSCLATLDMLMQQPCPIVGSMIVADKKKTQKSNERVSLTNAVAEILGISLTKASPGNALSDLGMDSIMSVEIKQMMERDFQMSITMKEIVQLTFGDLINMEMKQSGNEVSKATKIINNERIKENGVLIASL